jgi:hypothetical protein
MDTPAACCADFCRCGEEALRVKTNLFGWVLALAILLLPGTPVGGEEKYTVSGIVTFPEGDVVFVALYTPDRFRDFKNKPLPPEPFTQVIELSPEQRKAGKAEFLFKGIPRGTYGVVAFRASKKHLKKDRNQYFREPVSTLRMVAISGNWEDIKVEVNRHVRGIEIRF